MAHCMFRSFINELREAEQYAVIVDKPTDVSVREQVSIRFRIVRKHFETQELLCVSFNIADTKRPHFSAY